MNIEQKYFNRFYKRTDKDIYIYYAIRNIFCMKKENILSLEAYNILFYSGIFMSSENAELRASLRLFFTFRKTFFQI